MAYFKLEFSWSKEQKKQTLHTDEMKGWEWVKQEVERVRELGRYKTASNYLTAARSWMRFLGREDWLFSEMTADKVTAYQRWLSEQDICLNTISAYMRALRVMYHRMMGTDDNPFAQVFTGRAKTRKRSLLPCMLRIIERYQEDDSDYVFPILMADTPQRLHHLYSCRLRQYNYSLRRLEQLLPNPSHLSSYVVRHSWASIAYQHHLDISLIGKALGHTKTSTTLLYIRSLADPDLAEANLGMITELGL